jgi:hypothetical protein
MSSESYIRSSSKKAQETLKQYSLFNNIQVVIKDRFVEDLDLGGVLKTIENRIPQELLQDLDIIYIGDFPQLKARNVESAFMNGAIFLSNLIIDDDTLLKSIIHEMAHNVEVVFGADVYGDHQIIDEFVGKRKRLRDALEEQELFCDPRLYIQFDYSKTFDDFLYKTVGYDRLAQLTTKLYISPYAATSLREYFANGFEHYFVDENPKYLRSVSPKLFNKINNLTKIED